MSQIIIQYRYKIIFKKAEIIEETNTEKEIIDDETYELDSSFL